MPRTALSVITDAVVEAVSSGHLDVIEAAARLASVGMGWPDIRKTLNLPDDPHTVFVVDRATEARRLWPDPNHPAHRTRPDWRFERRTPHGATTFHSDTNAASVADLAGWDR